MLNRLALKPGDRVGILSTARWVAESDLQYADKIIHSWGLIPIYGETISARDAQFAGDDICRAKNLQTFLDDPTIKAILCARGGYGTIRIIDKIDFTAFLKNPKFICGFSDISVLHTHVTDKLGIATIHSCMPSTFPNNTPEALESLKNALFGIAPRFSFGSHPLNVQGESEGIIIGGNLSILYSLLGTKFGFSAAGKILFIEDIDEYLYHIDRMLMSLKWAGKLDAIKGIIIGGLTDFKDNMVPFGKDGAEIIHAHVHDLGIPVCFDFPAGHVSDNRAFYLGRKILLKTDTNKSTITYL